MTPKGRTTGETPWLRRALRAMVREIAALHLRLVLVDFLVQLLPHLTFPSVRRLLYRSAGVSIGPGALIGGRIHLSGLGPIQRRLRIGARCFFTTPLFVDLTAEVTIGENVTIGHHVVLVTADHEIGTFERRCGNISPKPIVIGDGVWIGARVTVLPGAIIGPGTVIGAGSLVRGKIPAGVLAVGMPARVIRELDEGDGPALRAGLGADAQESPLPNE